MGQVLGMKRSDVTMEAPVASAPARVLRIAVSLSLVAALAHATVIRDHFAEWWGYGVFFVVVALAQLLYTAALALAPSRRLAVLGIAGNAAVLALYVVSRTSGVPFLGPHAGEVEAVGIVDAVCGLAEWGLVFALALVARRPDIAPARVRGRTYLVVAGWVVVSVLGVPGGAVPAVADHEIGHVEVTPAPEVEIPPVVPHHPTTPVPQPPPVTEPTYRPEPSPCKPVVDPAKGIPSRGAAGEARALVTVHKQEILLHDFGTGSTRRLVRASEGCWPSHAVFKDEGTVTFGLGDSVYDLDLVSGKLDTVVTLVGGIGPFTWNPERSALAYKTWQPDIRVHREGTSKVVRILDGGGGRCGGDPDEVRLEWSPDGKLLLATVTYQDFTGKTMWVMSTNDWTDVVTPRMGTMGRWSPDAKTIYYRDFDWGPKAKWHALVVATGKTTTLGVKANSMRVAVSPDGRRLAYDDAEKTPSLYVYELATGAEKRLDSGRVHAAWLADDRVAGTEAKACGPTDECMHAEWKETGRVHVFELSGRAERLEGVASTMHAEVLFADESSVPAPTPAPTPSSSPSGNPSPSPAPTEDPVDVPTPVLTPTADPTPEASGSPEPDPTGTPSPDPTESPGTVA